MTLDLNSRYNVIVTIENKPLIRDPEGEVILRDLLMRNDFSQVKSVRTAKTLRFEVEASDEDDAKIIIKKMCDELRIYNPVVSKCVVEAVE